MQKFFLPLIFIFPVLLSAHNNFCREPTACFCPHRYIGVEFGGSWTMNANIHAPRPFWDTAINGYNSDLGASAIYGLVFGYHFVDFFRADIHYQYRPSYSYEKKQENTGEVSDKIRNFDLENQAILFSGYLQASGITCLGSLQLCGMVIDPFITGGVGISYNTVSSFYSESLDFPGETFSMMVSKQTSAFSWQAGIGLDFRLCCSVISLGYRYFYGGEFKSNNYLIDDPDGTSIAFQGVTTTPWKGKIKANELFASFRYPF